MRTVVTPTAQRQIPVKRITSNDVAALAGVSQSAVSRCFTQGTSIAEHTRQNILEAAKKLGYRPNAHARLLSTGQTRIVGVVLAHLDNLFYPRFLQLLTERLQERHMQVLLFVADGNHQADLMEQLLHYRVDGIVLAATTLNSELAHACAAAGISVVLFNRVPSEDGDHSFHSVQTDQTAGMRQLTQLLIDRGHQRIAYIAGKLDASTNQARERGCREALKHSGMSLFAYGVGNFDPQDAQRLIQSWYGRPPDGANSYPDAIVVADDCMAFAVMDALRFQFQLEIPGQVSVVGFDDAPQAAWPSYDLTTYAQPLPAMVEAILQLLKEQFRPEIQSTVGITNKADLMQGRGQSIVLQGQLCLRGSVRVAN